MRLVSLILLSALAAFAGPLRLVPVEPENLSPGRNLFLSSAKDTVPLCGDLADPHLIKVRDSVFNPGISPDSLGIFRIHTMEFSEFTYLRRSGDSLYFTAVPRKSAGEDFYPLCLRFQDVTGIFDTEAVQADPTVLAEKKPKVKRKLSGQERFTYALLTTVVGTGLGYLGGVSLAEAGGLPEDKQRLYGETFAKIGFVVGLSWGFTLFILPAM